MARKILAVKFIEIEVKTGRNIAAIFLTDLSIVSGGNVDVEILLPQSRLYRCKRVLLLCLCKGEVCFVRNYKYLLDSGGCAGSSNGFGTSPGPARGRGRPATNEE